jgi:hypothetical protein
MMTSFKPSWNQEVETVHSDQGWAEEVIKNVFPYASPQTCWLFLLTAWGRLLTYFANSIQTAGVFHLSRMHFMQNIIDPAALALIHAIMYDVEPGAHDRNKARLQTLREVHPQDYRYLAEYRYLAMLHLWAGESATTFNAV